LPKDVLVALFGVFYKLPDIGETMHSHIGHIVENAKPIDFSNIYRPEQQELVGEVSPFIREMGPKYFERVLKFQNHYVELNEEYVKMATDQSLPRKKSDSQHEPVYFAEGSLMLLPIRHVKDTKVIDDLLGADKQ
jgi:hypothetical protein